MRTLLEQLRGEEGWSKGQCFRGKPDSPLAGGQCCRESLTVHWPEGSAAGESLTVHWQGLGAA